MANLRRKESSPQASPDLSKKTPVNRTPDYSEDDSDIDDYDPVSKHTMWVFFVFLF